MFYIFVFAGFFGIPRLQYELVHRAVDSIFCRNQFFSSEGYRAPQATSLRRQKLVPSIIQGSGALENIIVGAPVPLRFVSGMSLRRVLGWGCRFLDEIFSR